MTADIKIFPGLRKMDPETVAEMAKEWREEKASELGLSEREMKMIERFEMIATGTARCGWRTDLEIAREIAVEAMREVGWPADERAGK